MQDDIGNTASTRVPDPQSELHPPLVSVVIPAYRANATIAASTASVLAQTVDDWELLIVDDCSPDDLAPALAFVADDSRVRIIRRDVNGGASAARNSGIDHARGHFVAFLDADDTWAPQKLARQLAVVWARPNPDRVFCVTQTIVVLPGGREIIRPQRPKRPTERLDEFIFVDGNLCQTSSFLVSRELAQKTRFRTLPIGEDHLFAIEAVNAGAEYVLVEEPLATYNNDVRAGRLSQQASLARGEVFLDQARSIMSAKALAGYEIRYLGVEIMRRSPLEFIRKYVRALRLGALSPRFAVTLLARATIPRGFYQRIRALVLGRGGASRRSSTIE